MYWPGTVTDPSKANQAKHTKHWSFIILWNFVLLVHKQHKEFIWELHQHGHLFQLVHQFIRVCTTLQLSSAQSAASPQNPSTRSLEGSVDKRLVQFYHLHVCGLPPKNFKILLIMKLLCSTHSGYNVLGRLGIPLQHILHSFLQTYQSM